MKIKNNKKICSNILPKGFLVLSLFLLSFIFISVSSVKAANNETIYGSHNDNGGYSYSGAISAGTNQILVCLSHSYYPVGTYGTPAESLYWHNSAMTKIAVSDNWDGQINIWYLINPEIGAYSVYSSADSRLNSLNCIVKENINLDSPITATSGFQNESYQYNMVNVGADVIAFSKGSPSSFTTDWTTTSQGYVNSYGSGQSYGASYKTITAAYDHISYSPNGFNTDYVELNTILTPPSTDFITPLLTNGKVEVEVCGATQDCIGPKISDWTVYYSICDKWDYTNRLLIGVHNTDNNNVNEYFAASDYNFFPMPRQPSGCRGSFQYKDFFSEEVGTANYHFFLRKETATTTIDYEFDPFPVQTNAEYSSSNGFINYTGPNPKSIDTTTGTSTSITFQYNVCDQDFEAGHFALENLNSNTILNITADAATCSGTGTLTMPYAQNLIQTLPLRIDWINASSTPTILGNSFQAIFWYTALNPYASTTAEEIFGTSADLLACPQNDWDTITEYHASTTMPFSWGTTMLDLRCHTISAGYSLLSNITNAIKWSLEKLKDAAANIFPFTIPIRFVESWNNSATAQLPTDLAWLNIADEQGNIYFSFPKAWTGGTNDTQWLVWGPSLWDMSADTTNFFSHFRLLINYGLYALWLINLYHLAHDIYNEYMAEKTVLNHDKNNWQL
jgi:hypothetical protein